MAYEIVYWPGFTGRAEPAILLLEDVGEPYTIDTDVPARIEALGQTEPVFACPLLIDGETVLSQTSVIVEYLAGKHGCDVAPADAIGAAQFGYNLADIWREIYEGRRDGSADFLTVRFRAGSISSNAVSKAIRCGFLATMPRHGSTISHSIS